MILPLRRGVEDRAEWWLDGDRISVQERCGAPIGSGSSPVKIRKLRIGGRLFILLDSRADDRETADDRERIAGYIDSNWDDRFGQGAEVAFRRFEIDL